MISRTKGGIGLKTFFNGTVLSLYLISHYFAEPIFIAACLFPFLYAITAAILFRLGSCGRMIAAKTRARRMVRKGVISGDRRELFYKKVIRKIAPEVRAAYRLFVEGRMDAEEIRLTLTRSVRASGGRMKGGMVGIGLLSTLSVFLAFYFAVPIGETVLRTALIAFFATLNGVALHFALYAGVAASERAADRLADILDGYVLREKRSHEPLSHSGFSQEDSGIAEREESTLRDLRDILRGLDSRERV